MTTEKQNFYLRIYDNYHYQDDSEAYNSGQFDNYEEALLKAKSIVDMFLENCWKKRMPPQELLSLFKMFGEDPVIMSNGGGGGGFSSWDYAENRVSEICKTMEGE